MADIDELDYKKENLEIESIWYLELENIKGIGKETVKDIGVMFDNMNELINALNEDKVPLRNDIVEKLKKELLKGGNK